MKKLLAVLATAFCSQFAFSQVYYTKTGVVSFHSHTAVEDIKAENFESVSFLDATKGELRFQLLIKGFKFPKATMQDHFNSPNYMDSDKFPKSEFKGTIVNLKAVDFKKDGTYKVEVEGDLTLHGETKKVKHPGTIVIKNGKPSAHATFRINRTDFGVKVPAFSAAKIAEEIDITVKCDYEPYKN
jgi:polyisoprenoid-binding protein YceI